jgi:sugar transferase (PEP-CTERM system associated)
MIRLFSVFFPSRQVALILLESVLIFTTFAAVGVSLFDVDPLISLLYEGGLLRTAFVTLTILLGIYFNDLYEDLQVVSTIELLQKFCLSIGLAFLAQALVGYGRLNVSLPRWQMVYGSAILLVVLPSLRVAYARALLQGTGGQRTLFLGTGALLREVASGIRLRPQFGVDPAGYMDDAECDPACPDLGPYLGPISRMREVAAERRIELIITGLAERRGRLPVQDLLELRLAGTMVEEAGTMSERIFGRISVSSLRPSDLIYSSSLGPGRMSLMLRDLYSWVIAVVALIIAAPVMLAVAILVKVTSPGPAIYRQCRVGVRGSEFFLYKFRSMVATAEKAGAQWAAKNDPRVTPLGKWLRRLRLDELPQLFNVVRGDMAIVGPRPERPEFVKTLAEAIPFYHQRHCVKPGITGWAQINHNYSDSVEDTVTKIEFDLYYIKHVSPSLDAYIMFQTAKVMLLQRGSR